MKKTKVRNFKDLIVWQKGIELADAIYDLCHKLPASELYCLSEQMRRCAISIPSNIAEGFNRGSTKDFRRFCYISLGSCSELETQLILTRRREYISQDQFDVVVELLTSIIKMIRSLINSLHID